MDYHFKSSKVSQKKTDISRPDAPIIIVSQIEFGRDWSLVIGEQIPADDIRRFRQKFIFTHFMVKMRQIAVD